MNIYRKKWSASLSLYYCWLHLTFQGKLEVQILTILATYDFGLHNKYAKDVFLALFLPEGSETNQPEDSKSNDQITSIYMYLQEKMKQSVTFLNATTPVAFQSFRYLTEPINTAEL